MKYHQCTPSCTPSFLHALSRNLYANNGSSIKDFGDDVVGVFYECVGWRSAVCNMTKQYSTPSFLQALSRNLYANNGSPIKDFGDDVVGSLL